ATNNIKAFIDNELEFEGYNVKAMEYFVDTSNIEYHDLSITIPLYHTEGFIRSVKLQEENNELNKNKGTMNKYTIVKDVNGNMSGFDGHIEIDRSSNKIQFSVWQ
ncbi:MAG: hypothetical protein MRY83_01145, partial [Flavobacteriales bacterium]|nr:hypothetical protein [Flavobacteriales bacterium]